MHLAIVVSVACVAALLVVICLVHICTHFALRRTFCERSCTTWFEECSDVKDTDSLADILDDDIDDIWGEDNPQMHLSDDDDGTVEEMEDKKVAEDTL